MHTIVECGDQMNTLAMRSRALRTPALGLDPELRQKIPRCTSAPSTPIVASRAAGYCQNASVCAN